MCGRLWGWGRLEEKEASEMPHGLWLAQMNGAAKGCVRGQPKRPRLGKENMNSVLVCVAVKSDRILGLGIRGRVWASKIKVRVITFGQSEAMKVRMYRLPSASEPWRILTLNDT